MAVNYYKHEVTCTAIGQMDFNGKLYYLSTHNTTCENTSVSEWYNTYKSGTTIPTVIIGQDGNADVICTVHSIGIFEDTPAIFLPLDESFLTGLQLQTIVSDELVDL